MIESVKLCKVYIENCNHLRVYILQNFMISKIASSCSNIRGRQPEFRFFNALKDPEIACIQGGKYCIFFSNSRLIS